MLSRQEPGIDELWARVSHHYADQPDLKRAEELYCTLAEELATFPAEVFETTQTLQQLGLAGPRIVQIDELRSVVAHVATGLHENTRDQVIFPVDRQAQFSRTASEKPPFHEVVASELIRQIEAGTAPWQKPWNADGGTGGMPLNPTTGKRYKGINAIHLLAQGHSDPRWLTYKQAVSLDAQVRKGERGTSIQYWKFEDTRIKTDAAGNPVMGPDGAPVQERVKLQNPRVFYATVFNAEQIDGLAPLVTPALTWDPVERAEQILANSGARIEHAATDRAYYSPSRDEIHLPLQAQFPTARNYYATALHELGHWTGHESRLKRDLSHPFRSEGYAREELRAEIASMMLSAELGLPHDPSQHAAYVASWVSVLKKDPLEIFRAAADAEKIHALAMSFAPELSQDVPSVLAVIGPAPSLPPSPAPKTQAQETRPSAQQERSLTTGPVSNLTPDTTKVIAMPRQPLSADDVRDALSYISPNLPRDDWARIGMALKSEFPKDLGLDLFDQWSSTGEGYDRNSVVSTWRSIRADGPVSIGTLLKQAKDNGFTPREPIESMQTRRNLNDPQAAAQRAADAAAQEQVRLNQQETAAVQALAMWDQATPDVTSAYLERKSVQAHGTRTTDQGTLLVPLVDQEGKLWNVQRVLPRKIKNGTDKLYLKGGRKSGLFHVIGSLNSALDAGQPVVIAEGYATAASAHEATGWPCVVSFDSGNLIKVTEQFRKRYPDALLVVAGDDDLPTFAKKGINPGRDKATLAAQKGSTALAFPLGLNPDQSDFNDLVAQWGPETGPQKIRASFEAALLEYVSPQQPQSASLAVDGGSPSGQLTAQQALAVKALNELKALDLHLSQAVSIENAPKIRSESVSVATAIPPVDETKSPVQPLPRFEVRRVGDFNEEQIGQFGQLSGAVYFAAGQDDAQALQIHLNGARLQGPELTAYLDAVVLERTTPAHSPGAQQLTQLHAAALAVTVSETSDVQQPLPYTVTRTERGLAEKIGEFNQLSSAVYFAAGQDDAKSLHIHHNGTPLEGPQLSAYLDATVLERTSPASSLGKDRLAQLHAAALPKEVQVGAANAVGAVAVQTETPIPTSTGADNPGFNPAKTPAANSSPLAPPQTPTETGAPKADPLTRPDPNNDLNLEALQAKRARDAEQVRQEMGRLGTPPKQTGSSADAPNAPPGLNSISSAEPTPEPGPDTYLYQELRDLRERLAKEYQHGGAGKYFFRQGKLDLAFEDTGSKLNTAHHVP
ncbi:zincin-like metallopeptidase domain-containing protein, partial [Limnohabitans sp.]|uniref:zincin-like metallopeptidase domain-containing protein n=1 Tax=Limnohabitans sp. TaxID=1907725 RepID=UPI0028A1D6BE